MNEALAGAITLVVTAVTAYFAIDVWSYPICKECHHNGSVLIPRRPWRPARCSVHGTLHHNGYPRG